jgi:hypothetical protein
MAIATIVSRGYGNSTFSGTISLVVTRGYSIAAVSNDTSSRAFCVVAKDTYTPGASAAQGYTAGAVREQTYHAGATAADNC